MDEITKAISLALGIGTEGLLTDWVLSGRVVMPDMSAATVVASSNGSDIITQTGLVHILQCEIDRGIGAEVREDG